MVQIARGADIGVVRLLVWRLVVALVGVRAQDSRANHAAVASKRPRQKHHWPLIARENV